MRRRTSLLALAAPLLLACPGGGSDDEAGSSTESATGSETDTATGTSDTTMSTSDTMMSTSDTAMDTGDTASTSDTSVACNYPEGAVEPMALGEVLFPYAWPEAIAADGTTLPLDLIHAPCADDPDIDWSVHELLVFISIPAW